MLRFLAALGIIFIISLCICLVFLFWVNSSSPTYVWKKINDKNMESSITCNENGTTMMEVDSGELMPLASTVKIVVAIEYAFQVEEGKLNPNELIDLSELEIYYVPNLDGGAHPAWLEYT